MILTTLKGAFLPLSYKKYLAKSISEGYELPCAAYLCLSALLWRNHDDNHGALSTERAVVRFRIAAVLWLAAPATSRRRQPARRSPNEQVIYFMAHDQIPTRATAGYAPRNQNLRWRLPLLAASRRRRLQMTLVRTTYPARLPVADDLSLIANLFFDVFMPWEHQKIEIQGITDQLYASAFFVSIFWTRMNEKTSKWDGDALWYCQNFEHFLTK